jgi:hypothetical protein
LKFTYDESLSSVAFHFNLRRFIVATFVSALLAGMLLNYALFLAGTTPVTFRLNGTRFLWDKLGGASPCANVCVY